MPVIPNSRDRIADVVADLIEQPSLARMQVMPVAWDVIWGSFTVATPQGPLPMTGYGIMITARAVERGGAVVLGPQRQAAQIHVLPGTVPTEEEIKIGFDQCMQALAGTLAAQAAHAAGLQQPHPGQN